MPTTPGLDTHWFDPSPANQDRVQPNARQMTSRYDARRCSSGASPAATSYASPLPACTHTTTNAIAPAPHHDHLLQPHPSSSRAPPDVYSAHVNHARVVPQSAHTAQNARSSTSQDYPHTFNPASGSYQHPRSVSRPTTPRTITTASRDRSHPYYPSLYREARFRGPTNCPDPNDRNSLYLGVVQQQRESSFDTPRAEGARNDRRTFPHRPFPNSPCPIPSRPLPLSRPMAAPLMQGRDLTSGPNFLSHAHDLRIESLNATTIGTYYARPSPTDVFKYLRPHIAHGAAHNSGERCDAPKCHPETRVAVQEGIMGWITDGERDNQPKRIMWLSGPAGSGKTAIAGSVAEICHEEGLLAASFFFSSVFGSAERRSKRCFIATLASHLAEIPSLWEYKEQLQAAIQRYPTVFEKDLKVQAGCLLIQPFRMVRVGWNKRDWPKVIFIDGLDEVEAIQYHDPRRRATKRTPEDDQNEILQVLLTLSCDSTFPFRIFVASRPESNITNFFTTNAQNAAVHLFLDSKYNPDADVERFLVSKFAHIRRHADTSFFSERIFVVLKNNGPIVLLPSLPDLAAFLRSFFWLSFLDEDTPEVLTSLSESSKAELASCDVAWWTTASLSNLLFDGSSLSQDGLCSGPSEGWGNHPSLARLMYRWIHQAMGCRLEAASLGGCAARQLQGSKCHAACLHWRTGILAKAKELGWCVHELEEVGLDELENFNYMGIHKKFKEPGYHKCWICNPALTSS